MMTFRTNIKFQGQLTRAIVSSRDTKDAALDTLNIVYRRHLERLVETLQDVVSKPGRSAPGQPPGLQTGRLRDSIKLYDRSSPDEVRFQVAVEAPYAMYLEFGTRKMAPRPFMLKTYNRFKQIEINLASKEATEILDEVVKERIVGTAHHTLPKP